MLDKHCELRGRVNGDGGRACCGVGAEGTQRPSESCTMFEDGHCCASGMPLFCVVCTDRRMCLTCPDLLEAQSSERAR